MLEAGRTRVERLLRLEDIISEPGAVYYGIVKDDRRYLQLQAVEPPVDAATQVEEQHRGLDETDGRRTRRSNTPEPDAGIVLEELNFDEY